MKAYLHLYHFDSGEEEQAVLEKLDTDGLTNKFEIVTTAEESNSVALALGEFGEQNIQANMLDALNLLSDKTLSMLSEMYIDISLRLVVSGTSSAYVEPKVLSLAGKKGVQIYIFNDVHS